MVFVGNKTETTLLQFVKELGCPDFKTTRNRVHAVQMISFSSERQCMGVVIWEESGRRYRVVFKGVSEILWWSRHHRCMRRPDWMKTHWARTKKWLTLLRRMKSIYSPRKTLAGQSSSIPTKLFEQLCSATGILTEDGSCLFLDGYRRGRSQGSLRSSIVKAVMWGRVNDAVRQFFQFQMSCQQI